MFDSSTQQEQRGGKQYQSNTLQLNPSSNDGHKWRLLGIILIVAGIAFLGIRMVVFHTVPELVLSPGATRSSLAWLMRAFKLVGLMSTALGIMFFNRGRKYEILTKQESAALDTQPPILYLRSFKDDPEAAKTTSGGIFYLFYGILSYISVATEEEQIAKALKDIGPFIAFGRPGEKLPEIGAVRMYIPNDNWQDRIKSLMSKARLVVLRLGETESLLWEMKEAVHCVNPEQLLFLVSFNKEQYEVFHQNLQGYLTCQLPEYNGGKKVFSNLRGIIYFEPNWTPHFIRLKVGNLLRLSVTEPLVTVLKMALKPVFEQLQCSWSQPKVKWYNILLTVVSLASAYYLLTVFVF